MVIALLALAAAMIATPVLTSLTEAWRTKSMLVSCTAQGGYLTTDDRDAPVCAKTLGRRQNPQ